jgi:hypothetical protein
MQFEEDEARVSDEDPEFTGGGDAPAEDEFIDDDDVLVDDDAGLIDDDEDEEDAPAADL